MHNDKVLISSDITSVLPPYAYLTPHTFKLNIFIFMAGTNNAFHRGRNAAIITSHLLHQKFGCLYCFDFRMFLARLDDAKGIVDNEIGTIRARGKVLRHQDLSENPQACEKKSAPGTKNCGIVAEVDILEKCSEYLFDLFDANLTPEYKRIDTIQECAIECFNRSLESEIPNRLKSGIVEYTFEQQSIHDDFQRAFEELISDFLHDEKISHEDFTSIVQKCSVSGRKELGKAMKIGKGAQLADEILDCIFWYTDFECWASSMRAEASYRRNMKLLKLNGRERRFSGEKDASGDDIQSSGDSSPANYSCERHL